MKTKAKEKRRILRVLGRPFPLLSDISWRVCGLQGSLQEATMKLAAID